MRERLRKHALSQVDVGTVEVSSFKLCFCCVSLPLDDQDFQGRESRVIIVSCVRAKGKFLDEDTRKGLGLMFSRKR